MAEESQPARASLRAAVVGVGSLGQHHARILSELDGAELVGVLDTDQSRAREVAGRHGVPVFDDLDAVCAEAEVAVVATPTSAHADVGVVLLRQGVHVLIEKPIAATLLEADRLLAERRGSTVLAIGHVEFYNPAVERLVELGGKARFLEFERLASFSPRSLDVDVLLDLMIHDLQLLHTIDASPIRDIRAVGINVLTDKIDIADVRLELDSGCVANLKASRISDKRVRTLRAFLSDRYFSLDFNGQSLRGFQLTEQGRDAGSVRSMIPEEFDSIPGEPLALELKSFLRRCRGEDARVVDGASGRRALATALAIGEAIRSREEMF